jgi:hypothetical protein
MQVETYPRFLELIESDAGDGEPSVPAETERCANMEDVPDEALPAATPRQGMD